MRKTGLILTAPLLAVSLAFAQQGGDQPLSQQPAPEKSPVQLGAQPETPPATGAAGAIPAQADNQIRAQEFIGMKVVDRQDNEVAKVNDLLLDKNGKTAGVVLSVRGFLGITDKRIALPWEQIEIVKGHNPGDKEIVRIAMTEEQLEAAPSFKTRDDLEDERRAQQSQRQTLHQGQSAPKTYQ
jgi:sporulation protein YlmC with PRC-barrel domain